MTATNRPAEIRMMVIYHPDDYPDLYVVREWRTGLAIIASRPSVCFWTLEEARTWVQSIGFVTLVPKVDGEDPVAEVWL